MKHIILSLLAVVAFSAVSLSNHIAGGDFTVRHISGNTFLAKLVLYRDCNGNLVLDQSISISVFDAVTNEYLQDLSYVMFDPQAAILQLGNSCYDPNLCIESQTYTQEIDLPNNPNGYYMTWERCCRNSLAININAADAGMVFTVQVADPALQSSTPEFLPYPAEAFLCVNGPNSIIFTATDEDGDELVYSFTNALRGSASSIGDPAPALAGPRPYLVVDWVPPYNIIDQVGGVTPLAIDPLTGVVSGQPTMQGFYTIAVQVDEFRNGVKIGEIRREIQVAGLLCNFDFPAEIFTPDDLLVFDVVANTEFCIEISAVDPNTGDTLFFQATGPLMDGTVLPSASFPDAEGFGSITQDFCWIPVCENVSDTPYEVTFIAFSRGCAADVFITTKTIFINVVLEVNEPTTLQGPVPEAIIDLYNPGTHCFSFEFFDPNVADSLFISASSKIFELPNANEIEFEFGIQSVTLPYCWFVTCADVRDEPYFVDFEVITTNCLVRDTNYFSVPVRVIVPENSPTTFIQPEQSIFFEFHTMGDSLCFSVTLFDENFFDTLMVSASGAIMDFVNNPANFSSETGLSLIEKQFCWVPTCEDVREEPYEVLFKATANSCKTNDEVLHPVQIFLTLPPESPPFFELPADGDFIEYFIGDDPISIFAVARDLDVYDTLTVTAASPAFDAPGNKPLFEPFTNNTIVASEFFWQPDCSDVSDDPYPVTFTVTSRSCQKNVSESVTIEIFVTTPTKGDINPIPNIFSPNRDGVNDFWTIEDKGDPCLLNFKATVFDRWGREVYATSIPSFEWNGENANGTVATDGTYFHMIEYFYRASAKSYSGNIQVVK